MFKSIKNKWHSLATIDRLVTIFLLIGLCGVTSCILWDTEKEVSYNSILDEETEDIIKDSFHWDVEMDLPQNQVD